MSETGADLPIPPTEPQIGPRDANYHPRQQEVQQPEVSSQPNPMPIEAPIPAASALESQAAAPQAAPVAESQPISMAPTSEPQPRMGLRDRLANLGKRAAEVVAQKPTESRLLPDQVSAQTVAKRMMLSRDDRTHLGFSVAAEMQWMGYVTEPKPDSPDYQQWLAVSQGITKANIDLVSAGILEQGSLTIPNGEKIPGFRVKDAAKLAQVAESKPVTQAHPNSPQQGK